MYKQVIVVNRSLNMSHGKMAAMVAHGSMAFLTKWFRENVTPGNGTFDAYSIRPTAKIDYKLFSFWLNGSFTKIILEADESQMEQIVKDAYEYGLISNQDYFNIVDDTTEFLGVPKWAAIAFLPMDSSIIDNITGKLHLYGYAQKEENDRNHNNGDDER